MGDSLDLVVVGAYYGKGKRTNWYGAFLLACYDPDSENFQTICKIGTGFSEEILQQFYDELHPLELTGGPRGDIEVGGAKPDVWFEPKVVWEVLTADLSLSPVYSAAHGIVSDIRKSKLTADREPWYLPPLPSFPEGARRQVRRRGNDVRAGRRVLPAPGDGGREAWW